MCGITGYLDLNQGVDIRTLTSMTNVVKHRGPDDEGYMLFDDKNMVSCYGRDTQIRLI